jgi:D-glycero-D-manno-heptose 1,7-bisphosphate phosphatase
MKYIILDRDGVINDESDQYIKSPHEWHAIPGSLQAIADLNAHGFKVLIATNQSGVAHGLYDLAMLNRIHEKMRTELAELNGNITEIFFCPHREQDKCQCRKPSPGMLFQMQKKYPIDFADCYFIGDSKRDIDVAETVGCKPILVLTGFGAKTLSEHQAQLSHIPHFANLSQAVAFILQGIKKA